MKPFKGIADDDKEKALRRGVTVPPGAVNLAWAKAPKISPKNNTVIVDTSRVISENQYSSTSTKKIAFANALGILEDINGNQLWDDEYPIISDQFINDDEYSEDTILPFLHVSRFFHLDFSGLSSLGDLFEFSSDKIKMVDSKGADHVNADGTKKYKIFLYQAETVGNSSTDVDGAYRVYAFYDALPSTELYFQYNKVEIDTNGYTLRNELGYKELVNARTYFKYSPEESDVIDFSRMRQKVYSSKPVTLKEKILGIPTSHPQGWKLFVPKKAINDTRIFQLFRWRVACEFIQNSQIDPSRDSTTVKVGIIGTSANLNSSMTPFVFFNLNKTAYNFSKVKMINPLQADHSDAEQSQATYWMVNLDTITDSQLSQFDLLVCAPDTPVFDLTQSNRNYISKINYFTENIGGTVLFDTANAGVILGLGIETSNPVDTKDGHAIGPSSAQANAAPTSYYGVTNTYIDGGTLVASDPSNEILFHGAEEFGGYTFDTSDFNAVSPYKQQDTLRVGFKYSQYITSYPSGYRAILQANDFNNTVKPVVVAKSFASGGNVIFSTIGLASSVASIFSFVDGRLITDNKYTSVSSANFFQMYGLNYEQCLNSAFIQGAMKLMMNVVYLSTRLKSIDNLDQTAFSSSFVAYTPWKASWVINAANGILTEQEKQKHNFILATINPDDITPVWQRQLSTSSVKQLVDSQLTAEQLRNVQGATRRYSIQTTNGEVITPSKELITNESTPKAWTFAYSPAFIVPDDFGPHVIREEEHKGEYDAGQYTFKVYPPKPFSLQANASYVTTSQSGVSIDLDITLTGSANYVYQGEPELISPGTPAIIGTPGTPAQVVDVDLNWAQHGAGAFAPSAAPWQAGIDHPVGITNRQELTYYSGGSGSGNLNWPYWGANVVISQSRGSTGDWVRFIQDALNRFYFFRDVTGFNFKPPAQTGIFDLATDIAVKHFQSLMSARWVDGIVDAETWHLFGWMIIKIRSIYGNDAAPSNLGGFYQYYEWPEWYMKMHHISDGSQISTFVKRSWTSPGGSISAPSRIADSFQIKLSTDYKIFGVTMVPFVMDSAARSQIWDWLHVGYDVDLANLDATNQAFPGTSIRRVVEADVPTRINIYPTMGNGIAFGIAQDQAAGFGAARIMGVRDIIIHSQQTIPGTPGNPGSPATLPVYSQGRYFSEPRTFTINKKITVGTGTSAWVNIQPSDLYESIGPEIGNYRDTKWTSLTVTSNGNTNPPVSVSYYSRTEGQVIKIDLNTFNWDTFTQIMTPTFIFSHLDVKNDVSGVNFVSAGRIGYTGTAEYYTMSPEGVVDLYPRTDGFVSKQEGIRLLCTSDGKPLGLPAMPTSWTSGQTFNSHFAKLSINSTGTDSFVFVGFYDKRNKEFVTGSNGALDLSYNEYITRGIENVYLAVVSKYELDESAPLPEDNDAPTLPYRWAMPVYGVTSRASSKIQVEPLPSDLGVSDIWPLPIKTGSYTRNVQVSERTQGGLTTFIRDYQGSSITAFYNIAEATQGPWSEIYGRPYIDIADETPIIIDDNIIQVRQAPLLLIQEPTSSKYSLADPWRPVVTVSKRRSGSDPWEKLTLSDISDYNIVTGTIILKENLYNNDPNMVKVSYVTSRSTYNLKHDGTRRINLNPYINQSLMNQPIYVYVLPEYCVDSGGVLIQASVRQRTILTTSSPSIFDPLQSNYDPLAVLLAVVYITSSFDLNDLVVLDTRRRGGGASAYLDENELIRMVQESSSYWDVNYSHASSYQKGGFIIIRLPKELKEDLDETTILNAIERNITAGVRYQLEDLEGNKW